MKRTCLALISALVVSQGIARADIINVAIQPATLSGQSGDVLAFFGTLTNGAGDTVFLNADNLTLVGFPPGAIDDSPYFNNTPDGFLGPNGSTGNIELFDLTIPALPVGTYAGSFEVIGGATPDDQTILGSGDFTAAVVSPEPAPWAIVVFTGLMAVGLTRLRRSRWLPGAPR